MDCKALEGVLGELQELRRRLSRGESDWAELLERVVEAILEPDAAPDADPVPHWSALRKGEGGRSPWRECTHENCRPVWTGGPPTPVWPCRR